MKKTSYNVRFVHKDSAFIAYPLPKIKKNLFDRLVEVLVMSAFILMMTWLILSWIGYF